MAIPNYSTAWYLRKLLRKAGEFSTELEVKDTHFPYPHKYVDIDGVNNWYVHAIQRIIVNDAITSGSEPIYYFSFNIDDVNNFDDTFLLPIFGEALPDELDVDSQITFEYDSDVYQKCIFFNCLIALYYGSEVKVNWPNFSACDRQWNVFNHYFDVVDEGNDIYALTLKTDEIKYTLDMPKLNDYLAKVKAGTPVQYATYSELYDTV